MKPPQFNRIAWGMVAGLLATIATYVTAHLWRTYASAEPPQRMQLGVFAGVGLGLFALGDYFGVIRSPYTLSAFSQVEPDSDADDRSTMSSGQGPETSK